MSSRARILGRIRAAASSRAQTQHPGSFEGWRPSRPSPTPTAAFADLFEAAGGEVELQPDAVSAAAWLTEFCADFDSVTIGATVPEGLRPDHPVHPPETAALGVSMAAGALAETGSLILSARDGRRTHLLPPTHVVFVDAKDIHETFRAALLSWQPDLPSAIGLHSGPSKSADIGRYLVRGVHGPGRVIAVVIGA